jgi:hypothetical protein
MSWPLKGQSMHHRSTLHGGPGLPAPLSRRCRTACLLAGLVLTLAGAATAQIRITPHAYIGGGFGLTSGARDQSFVIEDLYDNWYAGWNLDHPRMVPRAQTRFTFLEVDRFSIGYVFWGHCRKYGTAYSEMWVKKGKLYPFSDDLNFHGVTLQWDLRYRPISSRRVWFFLLAGAGKFYGSSKRFQYEFVDDNYYYYDSRITETEERYDGSAWMAGGGAVFFRHLFIYVGTMDFSKKPVFIRKSMDAVIGLRI